MIVGELGDRGERQLVGEVGDARVAGHPDDAVAGRCDGLARGGPGQDGLGRGGGSGLARGDGRLGSGFRRLTRRLPQRRPAGLGADEVGEAGAAAWAGPSGCWP